MAIAVIIGILFATFLTLILVPVLYSVVDDASDFFKRNFTHGGEVAVERAGPRVTSGRTWSPESGGTAGPGAASPDTARPGAARPGAAHPSAASVEGAPALPVTVSNPITVPQAPSEVSPEGAGASEGGSPGGTFGSPRDGSSSLVP